MVIHFSRYCVKCTVKKADLSPILRRLTLCYYRKVLDHQFLLNRSSITKRFDIVDFRWQLIFTVLTFITSVIVDL